MVIMILTHGNIPLCCKYTTFPGTSIKKEDKKIEVSNNFFIFVIVIYEKTSYIN